MTIMDERARAILLFILFLAMCLVALYFYSGTRAWHDKYQQLLDTLTAKLAEKDKQIEKLENEIKTYETWESVVHVEKFVIDPLVFNVKLDIDRDVFDNVESLKSFCLNQTARHISKVLKKNDNLYQLMYEQNTMRMRDNIIIRFRFSPFKEDADWSKVPISTKINDICQYKPLENHNPTTDISVL